MKEHAQQQRPPAAGARVPVLQRACTCGGTPGPTGECAACRERRLDRRRSERSASAHDVAPPVVHDVLRSPGRPLEPSVRQEMEGRLGHDFSRVRVHSDSRAAESARAVGAAAYTVGSSVAFGAGRYSPSSSAGRDLLAHELVHVAQQAGASSSPGGSIRIGSPRDAAEREADLAAGGSPARRGSESSPTLRRKLVVNPPAAAPQIEGYLNAFCLGPALTDSSGVVSVDYGCGVVAGDGCDCLCQVIQDPKRVYTVNVATSTVSTKSKKLASGTTASVPEASVFPNTTAVTDPVVEFPDAKSKVEFGSFDPKGKAVWAPLWRVFAHELCGHGRLKQSYSGGTGDRPGHDSTIDTENAIAGKFGLPARGHYSDPRQGESFFNETGKRGKVVFLLKDGLHFEAP